MSALRRVRDARSNRSGIAGRCDTSGPPTWLSFHVGLSWCTPLPRRAVQVKERAAATEQAGEVDKPSKPPGVGTSNKAPAEELSHTEALVQRALASSDGVVPWPHARLMVKGPGGVGKSTSIDAMAGVCVPHASRCVPPPRVCAAKGRCASSMPLCVS